jgi:hypothetical protein
MKPQFFITYSSVFIFNLFAQGFAQAINSDSVNNSMQLIRIEQLLMDAIPLADTATWKKYLDDKFFIVTEDGTRFNKQDFISGFKPLSKGYSGYIKVIEPKFVFGENICVISYVADEYETVFGQKLHTTYGVMNTYIRKDTSWSMIASQVFEIPQLPLSIKIASDVLKKYTGRFQLSDSTYYIVSFENDKLFGQRTGRQKEELFAETENIFFRKADTRGRKIFLKDENGRMQMLERRNGNDVAWRKIE